MQEQIAHSLEPETDASFVLDRNWRFVSLNEQAERILGRPRADLLGRSFWDEFPEAVGSLFYAELHRAATTQTPISWENVGPPLSLRLEARADPSVEGLSVTLRDITERRQVDEKLPLYAAIVESSDDSIIGMTLDGIITSWNAGAQRLYGYTAEEMMGTPFERLMPADARPEFHRQRERVRAGVLGAPAETARLRKDGMRVEVTARFSPVKDASGALVGMCSIARDITERRQAERALRQSEARKATIMEAALDSIITVDAAGRVLEFNPAAEKMFGYTRDEVLGKQIAEVIIPPSLRERHLAGFAHYLTTGEGPILRRRVEVTGMRKDRSEFPVELAVVPITGEAAPLFTAYLRDITEIKQAQAKLKADYEREALINQIGQAIRSSLDPDRIQQTAVHALGQALGADRCFYALIDTERNVIQIGQDWHRADLPSMAGEYNIAQFAADMSDLFRTGRALVAADTEKGPWSAQTAAVLRQLRVRALIDVPFHDAGKLVAGLCVAMADQPRAWTAEEVSLVEAIAAQTRTAVEAAHLLEREQNIATILQDALQPKIPGAIPGLALAHYYRAALEESSIGGDFYDVFPLEKGVSALVMGDVSGKGLPAAAQVATVRNMLRSVLYLRRTVAEAITTLNALLTSHDLLIGFVTLFVGIYEADTSTLTYVSCGHEPALVRRASTGAVERLAPTGLVLGAAGHASYAESTVSLLPGDALLLYTDGISEAGPSRHDLLGTEGLAALFAQQPSGRDPQEIVARVMAGVEAHAGRVLHDDACLLAACHPPA